jgi:hypothetical protein
MILFWLTTEGFLTSCQKQNHVVCGVSADSAVDVHCKVDANDHRLSLGTIFSSGNFVDLVSHVRSIRLKLVSHVLCVRLVIDIL